MNRTFSVYRRRPHIVDVITPVVYGVDFYRLKWAANFDVAHAAFISATNAGLVDPNVNFFALNSLPGRQVRIVFDPDSYAIPDGLSFWMQLFHVIGGVETQVSASYLVLPDTITHSQMPIVIKGQVPQAASSALSLQLDMPRAGTNVRITNESAGKSLFVATQQGGYEFEVAPGETKDVTLQGMLGSFWVRGGTGPVDMSAIFVPVKNR
jgi:hypothetical protein